MENRFYFNEKTNKALLNRLLKKDFIKPVFPSSVVKFSEREIEIIELLIKEYTTSEIGAKLYLSPRTVETIRQNMIHKAGARTVIGLIIFALKRGLVHI
jgi:DNA-binding NarL/FixJ family response regulator